jgi:Family of unknown function (DUF6152)
MKSKSAGVIACLAVLLAVCTPAFAHHGTPAYANKITELKGATVTKFMWSNPHSLIYFDVKDENGKVAHWVGETGSPAAMIPVGWTRTSVQPGDVITVYIYASKTGNPVGRLNHIILADGTRLDDTVLGGDKHPQ